MSGDNPLSSEKKPVTKADLLQLLAGLDVPDIDVLQDPAITAENLIPALQKFRISVPDIFFSQVADWVGLEFIETNALLSSVDIGCVLPYSVEAEALILLLDSKPGYIWVATANPLHPEIFERLSDVFHKKIEKSVVSLDTITALADGCYAQPHAYSALMELSDRQPDESAYRILVPWQKGGILIFLSIIFLALLASPFYSTFVLFTAINVSYFLINPVKFYISLVGLSGTKQVIRITKDDIAELVDDELPVYTLLVPLYHEREMLPHILSNIARIDYPREKLDVKILLEQEDEETLDKARKLGLFGNIEEIIAPMTEGEYRRFLSIFHPVVVPNAEIKTKPRACNYGLKRARGEFVVIYDAEDLPDRDQLKKVVLAFRRLGEEYACVQCLLNFYNSRKNLLTRWFSIEYSYYYDYYIQGLDKIEAPIPLGGTSNHFRFRTLRELGAWDPFNVTEDADLGMRIARKKLKTAVLDSHTYEEAVTSVRSWIKQRSRWVKGFVITWFVTMRHPIRVFRDIGLKNFIIFQTGFGGNFYLPLMNLFLWLVFLAGFFIPDYFSRWFDFWPFAAIAVFNLVVGNLFFLVMMLLATWKEKQKDLLIYSLFSPIYWIFMSIGAWKGFVQLAMGQAYKWEKTAHGVSIPEKGQIMQEHQSLSRPVRWIEVKEPEVVTGKRSMTPAQGAVSVGISIVLVLLVLILTGYIPFSPISDHVQITKVPGMAQALAPFEKMKAGIEPNFLNFEALMHPAESAPSVSLAPTVSLSRQRQVMRSEYEPGLTLRYEPAEGIILVTADGLSSDLSGGSQHYLVQTTSPEGSAQYRMDPAPSRLEIPGGDALVRVEVFRVYSSGSRVLVLSTTV